MDGLTGVAQEKMRSNYKTKSYHMMLNMNLWSIGFLSVMILYTGELITFASFVHRYSFVMFNILLFSLLSGVGQVGISVATC